MCCCLDNHFGPISLGLGFLLAGSLYSTDSSIDLTSIGEDRSALMCLTPLTSCCRSSDTGTSSLGDWRYPDKALISSRSGGDSISRSRGPSSVILHRTNNAMSPTGVYTCEIPDANGTTKQLDVYLYVGQLPGQFFSDSYCSKCQSSSYYMIIFNIIVYY